MENSILAKVIERDPAKVSGQRVFAGTRVSLTALFENLKDGTSVDEFLAWFSGVKREQVSGLLNYQRDC